MRFPGIVLLGLGCALSAPALAQPYDEGEPQPDAPPADEEPGQPKVDTGPALRNPQGSVVVQGLAGMSAGGGQFTALIGLGVGYAVFTGVVPGVRGALFLGDVFGGELLGNLTLSPPLAGSLVPFVAAEGGYRWEAGLRGPMYGVGGGLFLGDPTGPFGLQIGVMYRVWDYGGAEPLRVWWPIAGLSVRF